MIAEKFELPKDDPLNLVSYLKKYKRQFWIQSAGGILYNTVIVTGPILLGRALDAASNLEKNGPSPGLIRNLAFYCILFLLVTVFFQYARYIKRWYIRDMSNRIACDMRSGILSSVLKFSMDRIEKESVGDLMSRTVGDVEQIVSTMQSTINEAWDTWLLMISYFVVLLYYDPLVTLLCSIPIPIAIYAAEWARHPLYRFSINSRKAASVVNSHLQRALNGLTILRLFGREDSEKERLKNFSIEQMNWTIKTNMLQTGMMPVYATIASLGVIGVIGLAGRKVINGQWSIGYFTAYLSMFTAMSTRTWVAARVFNQFHAAKAAWDRIKDKLAMIIDGSEETKKIKYASVEAAVLREKKNDDCGAGADGYFTVKNLSFSYPGSVNKVLDGISFTVKKGELVGVTGPVGSGKSTLAAVLTGLYSYSGEITLEGRSVFELSGAEKAAAFAYSGQDAFLFSASIAQNITFRPSPLTEEEKERLNRSLYLSALNEDIKLFPQGIETQVGEKGIRISGGQRQRIALARAIYTGNPILILDDPFSAVDINTEKEMIERIRQNLRDTTIFIFSHRLAAFTVADRILVLDKGRLIEQGTHEELITGNGIYSKIYIAQKWMEADENE